MSPDQPSDRWRRIEELFHEALERPADERGALLAERCGDDPSTRREVEELLAAEAKGGRTLPEIKDRPAPPRPAPDFESHAADTGRTIGHYRLLQLIDTGGMGTVWRAERADGQFEQEVAVKLIRRGLDTDDMLARFRQERQLLAGLRHPNIAQLLDGGATDDGLPYLVMEYVPGARIDRYCDDHRLSLDDRLRLFQRVCGAVHRAHQGLVVHRDLKPSNILVTDDGDPKLLDFGIAKVLQPGGDATAGTESGQRLMTMRYASPEQVRGDPITTASDVYSLGVVLYELITGHPPYEVDGGNPIEYGRAVCEHEPSRPSTAVLQTLTQTDDAGATTTVAPATIGAARREEPRRLARRLTGDLDTIVLTALRKEPQRRYTSAEALAEDLRRFGLGLPVSARPDSWGYRLQKFVRRNAVATAAAALVVLALVAATAFSARAARREAAERRIAQTQSAVAEAINEFLNDDLLAAADPFVDPDPDVTMRVALDRAAARVEGRFDQQPLVEAGVRATVGRAYLNLGIFDEAEWQLGEALRLHEQELGPADPRTISSMVDLADLYVDQGRHVEAEPLLNDALPLARRELGSHPITARVLNDLGVLHLELDRSGAAEPLLLEAVDMFAAELGEDDIGTLSAISGVAELMRELGRWDEAEGRCLRILEAIERAHDPDHPLGLMTANNLAYIYLTLGRNEEADVMYRDLLEAKQRVLGPAHRSTLVTMSNLSRALRQQGRGDEAEPLLLETVDLFRATLGDDHPDTIITLASLGMLYAGQRRFDQAIPIMEDVLALRTRSLGEDHSSTLMSMQNLGAIHLLADRPEDAEPFLTGALDRRRATDGDAHPDTLVNMVVVGDLYTKQQRYEEAIGVLVVALAGMQQTSVAPAFRARGQHALGLAYRGQDRLDEAAAALTEAYELLGPSHPRAASIARDLAEIFDALGRPGAAAAWRDGS